MTQIEALHIMKMGHNVFLTGAAGAGKTYVLNQYIEWLKDNSIPVSITASTGIAATHIGGITLHSFAGLEIHDEIDQYVLDKILQKQTVNKRINSAKVLIIDEVSMLRASVLDAVNIICQKVRGNEAPFGGLQIIFCGDFFQLPPVITNRELSIDDFAFNAKGWIEAKPVICYITENHRQSGNTLNVILNNIRSGELDYDLLETLNETIDRDFSTLNHVKLYTHNVDVDSINLQNYNLIQDEEEREYYMNSVGRKNLVEKLKATCLSPELLRLKKGVKVMFTRNDKFGKYNNGTIGEVLDFTSNDTPIILLNNGKKLEVVADSWRIEEDGKILAQISQLPLRYAWAITIHKSQGMTLDAAEIDLSRSFGYALGYVALSRVRDIEGIKLLGANMNAFAVHPEIHKVDQKLRDKSQAAVQALQKYKVDDLEQMHKKHAEKNRTEKKVEVNTFDETKRILLEGKYQLDEIAKLRELTVGTIITHIEVLCEDMQIESQHIDYLIARKYKSKKILNMISDSIARGEDKLNPLKALLDKAKIEIDFETLRLLRLLATYPDHKH